MRCQLLAKQGAHMVDAMPPRVGSSWVGVCGMECARGSGSGAARTPRQSYSHSWAMAHAAPASSAGVERVFSAAGKMHSDLRKSLGDSSLQHSIFACFNTE